MRFMTQATALLMIICTAALVGCGKDNNDPMSGGADNGGGGVVAQVPTANNCLRPVAQNAWNYGPGFQQYNWQMQPGWGGYGGGGYAGGQWGGGYNPQLGWGGQQSLPNYNWSNQGFCGCPNGAQPVCDPNRGMVCVQTSYMQGQVAWWGWNTQANNFGWSGYAGYNSYMGNGCYNQVGQTCIVGTASCGGGSICRAVGNGNIGICSR